MMARRVKVVALALFALAMVMANSAHAELATHEIDEERWGTPRVVEPKVLPPTLRPIGALTGFETNEDELKDPCGLLVSGGEFIIASYHSKKIYKYFDEGGNVHWYLYGDVEQRKALIYGEPENLKEDIYPDHGPCQLAAGSGGEMAPGEFYSDIYVNLWHSAVIAYRFTSASIKARTVVSGRTTGIAVHHVNPFDGEKDIVYANHGTYIGAYTSTGDPVMDGSEPLRIGVGSLGDAYGLARSAYPATDGYLYVADATDNTVKVFDPATDLDNPVQVIDGAETPGGHFQHLEDAGLAVNNATGQIFIADQKPGRSEEPPAVIYEYGRFGNYRGYLPDPAFEPLVSSVPTAIAFDSSGYIYVTSGLDGPGGIYAYTPSAPTKALELDMSGTGGGTVTSFPEGIDCTADCGTEFAVGKTVTLTATPEFRSKFLGWKVEGAPATCAGTGPCSVQLDSDAKVTAEFEQLPQESLDVSKLGSGGGTVTSSPEGIDCGSSCSSTFNKDSTVTLTAAPDEHSSFTGWAVSGNPGACPGTAPCEIEMSAAVTVSATFAALPQETLSVSLDGNGSGVVTSAPEGIDCGEACSAEFDLGDVVTLSATPAPGSRFAGWSGAGCSGTGTCEVTISSSSSITAAFERIEHTVTVVKTGAGTGGASSQPNGISCGGSCSHRFFEGEVVTLTADPAIGTDFAGWSGPCTGRRRCTFVVSGETTVRADFRVAEWTLAVVLSGEGLGTVTDPSAGLSCGLSCSGVYLHGTPITLVAKPSLGSYFAGWRGCDRPEGTTCSAIVDGNETVDAVFSLSEQLVLGRIRDGKGGKTLTAIPSAPGTISVAGKGIKKDTATADAGDQPVTLELELSSASVKRLRQSEHDRLGVKVKVRFTPRSGAPAVTKTIGVVFNL